MWDTGYRADLEELGNAVRRRGLPADRGWYPAGRRAAAGREGAERLDLATHGYKWLLSGFGIAALYVAPEAVDRIAPTFVGVQSWRAAATASRGG